MAFSFTGQDARSGRKNALDNYDANSQWDDLGLHRVENLPLAGDKKRSFRGPGAFDRPPPRNAFAAPSAAPAPAAKAEIQAKWGSLYDESQDFTRADGIGGGDLHRSGENYRPSLRRSNSLGARDRTPMRPARNYGAFGPPGLPPPPPGLNPFKNAFGGMPPASPAVPARPSRVWGGALIGSGDSQAFLSAMLPGKVLGAPSSGLAASRYAPPELKLAAQQPAATPPAPVQSLGSYNRAFGIPGSGAPSVANPPLAPAPAVINHAPLRTTPVFVAPKVFVTEAPKQPKPLAIETLKPKSPAPAQLIVYAGDLVSDFVEGVVQFTHPQFYKITGLEDILRKFRQVLLQPELMVVFKAEVDAKRAPLTPSPEPRKEESLSKSLEQQAKKVEELEKAVEVVKSVIPDVKVNDEGDTWKSKAKEALKTGNLRERAWGVNTPTSPTPLPRDLGVKSPAVPSIPPTAPPSGQPSESSEKPKSVPVSTSVPSIQKESTGLEEKSQTTEISTSKNVDLTPKSKAADLSFTSTKSIITPAKPNLPPHLAKKLGVTSSSSSKKSDATPSPIVKQPGSQQPQPAKVAPPAFIKKEEPAGTLWGEVPKVKTQLPHPAAAAAAAPPPPPPQVKAVAPAPPPATKHESIGWGSGEASKPTQAADQLKKQVCKDPASNSGVPTPVAEAKKAPVAQGKKEPTEEELVLELARKLHGTTIQNITANDKNRPTPPAPEAQKKSLRGKPKEVPVAKETSQKEESSNGQTAGGPTTATATATATAPSLGLKASRHAPTLPTSGSAAFKNAPNPRYNPTAKAAPPQVTHTVDPEVELRAKKAELAKTKPWNMKVSLDITSLAPSCPTFTISIACNQDPSSEVLLALRQRLAKEQYEHVVEQSQFKEYVTAVAKAFNAKMNRNWGTELRV